MRGGGLRKPDTRRDCRNIAGIVTAGRSGQNLQDLQAHRIAQRPELLGEEIQIVRSR
jgi:hypothetical protein